MSTNGLGDVARPELQHCRPLLTDYLSRAERLSCGRHTPHLLSESLGWHNRYLRSGHMRPRGEE